MTDVASGSCAPRCKTQLTDEPKPKCDCDCLNAAEVLNEQCVEKYLQETNAVADAMNAPDIIKHAYATFGDRMVMTTSFGLQSAVLLHMVSRIVPTITVIWIDTGYLPAETYLYAQELIDTLKLNVKVMQPEMSAARMEAIYGKLWETKDVTSHHLYGKLRKVEPMNRALEELNAAAVIAGLRAEQTTHRSNMRHVEFTKNRYKVAPILKWTTQQVKDYFREHNLPPHPLEEQGYTTVGDWHSSKPGDGRETRFNGVSQECGLHVDESDTSELTDERSSGTEPPSSPPSSGGSRRPFNRSKSRSLDIDATEEYRQGPTQHELDGRRTPTRAARIAKRLIRTKRPGVVIFSKPNCRFCKGAKSEFDAADMEYEDFTVGEEISLELLNELVGKEVRTVPQIFFDGAYVGGFTDLCSKLGVPDRVTGHNRS